MCVDNVSNRSSEGNPIKAWPCNGSEAQIWTFGTDATLRARDMCLRPGVGTPDPGTRVELRSCDGSPFQDWHFRSDGALVNTASGLCLRDSTNDQTATDNRLTVETCTGGADQRWTWS
jgi:hypothetical protein